MDFEQMKTAWRSQEEQPVIAMGSEQLYHSVRRRSRKSRWNANLEEVTFVLVCIFAPAINGFYGGEHAYETIGAAVYLCIAGFVLFSRLRRKRTERSYGSTMVGELDRTIYRLDYLIWRAQRFAWWFLLPTILYTATSLTQHFTWFGCVAAAITYPLAYFAIQLSWRRGYLSERRALESLRSELIQVESVDRQSPIT